ncbi:fluoride efflux transporter FluC [Pseudonocardia sichuanensis]
MVEGRRDQEQAEASESRQPEGGGPGVVDPDVDLRVPAQRRETAGRRWDVLAAIAAGGVLGAEARYALAVVLPHGPAGWPWSTFLTNVSGCVLIGVLMVVITERVVPHRLVRPFLGVGVLGGYTTFSTATVDALSLVQAGRPVAALGYAVATPVLAVVACVLGGVVTRLLLGHTAWRAEAGR